MSVSMLALLWRSVVHALRKNGAPPMTRTGVARRSSARSIERLCECMKPRERTRSGAVKKRDARKSDRSALPERSGGDERSLFLASLFFTAPLLVLSLGFMHSHNRSMDLAELLLATPVLVIGGAPFFRKAWTTLRHKSANMDTLIALGAGAAYLLSVTLYFVSLPGGAVLYFESACTIITLVLLGRWLEARAKHR